MADSLDLKIMAEGVETLQQAHFLMSHNCLTAQGFYFSGAIPAEAFSDKLAIIAQPLEKVLSTC